MQGSPSLLHISVANFFTLANAISGPLAGDNVYGLRDVFSTTIGTHTINAGGEVYLERTDWRRCSITTASLLLPVRQSPTPHQAQATTPDRRRHGGLPDRPSQYDGPGLARRRQRELLELRLLCAGRLAHHTPADAQPRSCATTCRPRPSIPSAASPSSSLACSRRSRRMPCSANSSPVIPACPLGVPKPTTTTSRRASGFTFDPYGTGRTVFHGGAGSVLRYHLRQRVDALAELPALRGSRNQCLHAT